VVELVPNCTFAMIDEILSQKAPKGPKAIARWVRRITRLKDRTRTHLELVLEFYQDRGCAAVPTLHTILNTALYLSVLDLCGLQEKYLKFKFCYSACIALKQTEFPQRPSFLSPDDRSDHLLFGGGFWIFHRHMLHHADLQYGVELTQLKKGAYTVEQLLVNAAVRTCHGLLTTTRKSPDPPEEDWGPPGVDLSIEALCAHADWVAGRLFPPGWYTPGPLQAPSIAGHVLSTRERCGALGSFCLSRDGLARDDKLSPTLLDTLPDDPDDFCLPWLLSDDQWISRTGLVFGPPVSELPFEDITRHLMNRPVERLNLVRTVGLPEPFKVRVITGGPEGRYYLSKYIQRSTHTHLRNQNPFRLIGAPITPEYMNSQLGPLGPGQFYVSGDYTGATDNLDPRISEAIGRRIGLNAGWSSETIELYIDSLTKHRITTLPFKNIERGLEEAFVFGDEACSEVLEDLQLDWIRDNSEEQCWGQLMGSPTSFPVLCVANAALTSYALMQYSHTRSTLPREPRDWPLAFNGDDVGFKCTQPEYVLWKQVTTAGGLAPSMGKNFTSTEFCVLNSTFFRWDGQEFVPLPYINYGLLFGDEKAKATHALDKRELLVESSDLRTPGIGSLASDLVKGHGPQLQKQLLKRFLKRWFPHLDAFCPRGTSYYLPTHLGGLGLPVVGEWTGERSRYSRSQLVLASLLDHDHERQRLLLALSRLNSSENPDLWTAASGKVDEMLARFPPLWERCPESIGSCAGEQSEDPTMDLLSPALALSVLDYNFCLQKPATRYDAWRDSRERLFRRAERSTFPPMEESAIASARPWRKTYPDFTGFVNRSGSIDLRQSRNLPRGPTLTTYGG